MTDVICIITAVAMFGLCMMFAELLGRL